METTADVHALNGSIEYLQRQVLSQADIIETLGVHLEDCRAEKTAQIEALTEVVAAQALRLSMLEARLGAIHGATAPLDEIAVLVVADPSSDTKRG